MLAMLVFSIFAAAAGSSELGTSQPSSSRPGRQSIESTIHELADFNSVDIEAHCRQDCSYNSVTNTTTCKPGVSAHHKMRCQNILWSADLADNPRFKHCEQFLVSDKGNLGPLGDIVFNEIVADIKENKLDSPFLQDNDSMLEQHDDAGKLQELCPAFNRFDDVTRAQFYLYLMENIAYRETSCTRNDAVNKNAPTTNAVCVFQLEQSNAARAMRPPACRVKVSEITKPENCGKCAVQMMKWHLTRPREKPAGYGSFLPEKPFGSMNPKTKVVNTHSYWQALNPETPAFISKWRKDHPGRMTPHEGLMNGIKYFPPCRASLSKDLPQR